MHWQLESIHLHGDQPDVEPTSGSVFIQEGRRDGQIALHILADDVAELNETFRLVLKSVEGGAEVDSMYNTSEFVVRY